MNDPARDGKTVTSPSRQRPAARSGSPASGIAVALAAAMIVGLAVHRAWAPAASPAPAAGPPPGAEATAAGSAPAASPARRRIVSGAAVTSRATGVVPDPTPDPPADRPRPGPEAAPARSGDLWYEGAGGYRQALAEATADRRPMAVYFRTDWCPYCKRLDRGLLADSTVQGYLRTVVKVRINPERGLAAQRQLVLCTDDNYSCAT